VIAGASAAYFHFVRNQEISTVREARALSLNASRIEIVSTLWAKPYEQSVARDVRSVQLPPLFQGSGYLKTVHVDKGDMVEFARSLRKSESPNSTSNLPAHPDLVNKHRNLARHQGLFSRGNADKFALYQAETMPPCRTMLPAGDN